MVIFSGNLCWINYVGRCGNEFYIYITKQLLCHLYSCTHSNPFSLNLHIGLLLLDEVHCKNCTVLYMKIKLYTLVVVMSIKCTHSWYFLVDTNNRTHTWNGGRCALWGDCIKQKSINSTVKQVKMVIWSKSLSNNEVEEITIRYQFMKQIFICICLTLFPLMTTFDTSVISLQCFTGLPLDHFRHFDSLFKTWSIQVIIFHKCYV